MATAKEIPLAERISATYPKLRSVAKDIHEASDELEAKQASEIAALLQAAASALEDTGNES